MLTITEPADLDALARLRHFVAQACTQHGIDQALCVQLQLAVDELCTNIIEHGYANRAAGSLTVSFLYTAPQIQIIIQDQGLPFDPRQAATPDLAADWEERAIGGLGIHLAQQAVDQIDYTSDPIAGNSLVLIKEWKAKSS